MVLVSCWSVAKNCSTLKQWNFCTLITTQITIHHKTTQNKTQLIICTRSRNKKDTFWPVEYVCVRARALVSLSHPVRIRIFSPPQNAKENHQSLSSKDYILHFPVSRWYSFVVDAKFSFFIQFVTSLLLFIFIRPSICWLN